LRGGIGLEFGADDVINGRSSANFFCWASVRSRLAELELVVSTSDLPIGSPSA